MEIADTKLISEVICLEWAPQRGDVILLPQDIYQLQSLLTDNLADPSAPSSQPPIIKGGLF